LRGAEPSEKNDAKCREIYADVNCCRQESDCRQAWEVIESNRLVDFRKDFLDITPRYRPDLRYTEELPTSEEEVQRDGLSLSAERTWKNVKGRPLGLLEGEILGLDGSDWEVAWRRRADEADLAGRPRPPRPLPFVGRVIGTPAGGEVRVETPSGKEFTLPLDKLSLDDKYWVRGRPWRNRHGEEIAFGRFIDYRWGRVVIEQPDGQTREVPLDHLGDDELCYVGAYWGDGVGLPDLCRIRGAPQLRDFRLITFHWKASALCHKPLYFEEVQLERYGHSFGPLAQPIVSTAHFFANIAIVPYKMGINPPHECMYALGYYRPGSCAPYMIPPVPYSVRGGLYEAGAWVGGVAIFP